VEGNTTTRDIILTVCGFILLGLGAVGIVLPVMPTTPFVLLAAICFSKSNKKFASWLKKNRFFGPYIENYHTKQGIKKSLKIVSISILWIGLLISMSILQTVLIYIILSVVGICVTIHLLMIKTKQENN